MRGYAGKEDKIGVSLSLDLLKKRRYNKRTVKKFYPKERGAELKSKNQSMDMTQGVIWKQLAYFALPLFLGNLSQQLYNTADSIIVGKFVGKDALAAVSSSGNLIFMMTGFFMGLFVGAGVIISRYFGAKCYDRLEAAVHTDLAFAMVCGVLLTLVGIFLTPQILVWMRTPEDVLPQSIQYFRLYFMGSLFMIVYNACMGILQAVGDSRHPLYYLIFSSIVNIVLDLIFCGGFRLGVEFAALATVISQMLSVILCLIRLIRTKDVYQVNVRKIRFDWTLLKQIIHQGLPSGMQNSIISIANMVVQSNINAFGKMAMAGCGAYSKIEGFGFLPITCFAMAMTTFIGQNLGAKEFERVKKGARFGILCGVGLAEGVGIAINLFIPQLIALFDRTPEVIRFGVTQARIVTLFYFLLSFSHVIAGIMRGAGKSVVPMLVMLISWCLIRITYVTITIHFIPDIRVVFWAYPLTWSISSVIFMIYYKKADWIHYFDRQEEKQCA